MASDTERHTVVLKKWDNEAEIPSLIRGGGVAAARAAGLGLRLLNLVVIGRAVGLTKFGDLTAVLALAAILALPLSLGFQKSVFAHIPTYQSSGDVSRIAAFRSFALMQMRRSCAALWITGLVIAAILANADKSWWWMPVAALAVATANALLSLEAEIVRARDRPLAAVAAIGVIPQLTLTIIVSCLWLFSATDTPLFVLGFAGANAASLLLLRWLHYLPSSNDGTSTDRAGWASYRVPLLLAGTGQLVLAQAPILLLRSLSSGAEAGGYSAAYRLAALVTLVPAAMASASTPGISMHLGARRFDAAAKGLQQLLRFNVPLVAGMAGVMWLFPSQLLSLFGSDFVEFAPQVRVLVVGLAIGSAIGPVSTLLIAFKRKGAVMAVYVVTAILFVVAMMIVSPATAASTAWLLAIAMAVQNIVQAVVLRQAWIADKSSGAGSPQSVEGSRGVD